MTNKTKDLIKAFFETGDRPTQAQFIDLIDSYVDKSGPIGTLETACSGGTQGAVVTDSGGTPSIAPYSTLRTSQGITVYTTALAQSALTGIFTTTADVSTIVSGLYATTAQAIAGTNNSTVMTPVLARNAIQSLAFTSANYASTAQANAGTDSVTVMSPVLTKNAIAALGSSTVSYAKLSYTLSTGTGGPTYSASTWNTVPLNTEDYDPSSIVSIATNQFTLAAGTYKIRGTASLLDAGSNNQVRLRNITDSTTSIVGMNVKTPNATTQPMPVMELDGFITIAGSKTFELQIWNDLSPAQNAASGSGENEIYATVIIQKIA